MDPLECGILMIRSHPWSYPTTPLDLELVVEKLFHFLTKSFFKPQWVDLEENILGNLYIY